MDNKISDSQINHYIRLIAEGDREALKCLYDELKNAIYSYAFSILKNHQMAEDVLQDSFLNIIRYSGTYRREINPRAWLFSVVRNCCYRCMKTAKPQLSYDERIDEVFSSDSLAGNVEKKDGAEIALSVLDESEREIVTLYVFAGLKQTEIAKLLSMPYIKVRSKYGYAMKKLKNYYLKEEKKQ